MSVMLDPAVLVQEYDVVESITGRHENNKNSRFHDKHRLISVTVGGPLKCGMSPHDYTRSKHPRKSRSYGIITSAIVFTTAVFGTRSTPGEYINEISYVRLTPSAWYTVNNPRTHTSC